VPYQIILSTDPGIDDALAIIFLSKLKVLKAIWTTVGNNTLEVCTHNAMKLLELLGRKEIPIIKGAAQSLSLNLDFIAEVHGKDGLGNTFLPLPDASSFIWKNLDYIISILEENPGEITIVSIGPLTNLAILLQKASKKTLNSIKEIIIMGGAVNVPGNVTPYAEFNIYSDPKAAKLVLTSKLPMILVGLDITHKVILTEAHIQVIEAKRSPLNEFIAKMSRYYLKFHKRIQGGYLHDPLAAAVAIDPSLITTQDFFIDVILDDPLKFGQTYPTKSREAPVISVGVDVNSEKFLNFFMNTLLK